MKKIELKLALLVCLIAILGLLGWFNNWVILGSVRAIYVPMAPLTAVLLILVSALYASMFIKINHKLFLKTTSILAALGILITSFSLIDYFFIPNWDVEKAFFAKLISEGVTGEISPLAAVLLMLANTSYLFLKNRYKKGFLFFIKASFYIQFIASFLFIIAHVENFDEIYKNNIFSLAFPTAFCLFVLSMIQLKYIKFQVWPFKYFSYHNATNKIVASLLPIFLLYFIVYQYYNYHLNQLIDNKYAHPLFLLLGIVVFYFMIIKVTKNIDNELEESKSLFQGLFNNATVGLYQSTPNGTIISANDTLVKMLKYDTLEDLLRIDITKNSYVFYKKREEFKSALEQFGKIKDFESEWITKTGEIITVNEGARAVKDENGIIIRYDGVVEDITKRKNNELILLKMNNAIEHSSDVIFMTDIDGVFSYINPEFTKLYQYTREEVVGKTTPRILKSGKQSTEFYQQFWRKISNKQSIKKFHFINKKKNGKLVDVDVSADPIIDEIGNTIGYIGIQRDITERIRNEQIQNIIVNISNASQFLTDTPQIIKLVQTELGRLVDTKNFYVALYDEENDTIDRIFYEDEKDKIVKFPAGKTVTGLVIKEGKSYLLKEAETRKLAKENAIDIVGVISKVWLGVPLIINGKAKGAFVIQSYEDENAYNQKDKEMLELISNQISIVIERKYQEDQLKIAKEKSEESERRLNLFFTQSLDGFFFMMHDKPVVWNDTIDKEKTLDYVFKNQRVTKVNNAMLMQYRATEAQFSGITPSDFFAHDINYGRKIWKDLFDKGNLHIDSNEKKFDNTDMIVEGSYQCFYNAHNEILGIFGIQREVTEVRQAEKNLLKAKEKAEESDRLKSSFLANMSHEIRTPMNSILGFSDLLMHKEKSYAKQDQYHEIINASGKRLMNLINDIVDISKIDAKELKLQATIFNLNKLINQLQEQFLISPKNKNTSITTVKFIEDANSFIHLDENRLAQVLSNLLENALKFTHNGTVEMGYTLADDQLHFYIKDSGVGIDKKDHQHIFERFAQSDNEILKLKEGSGLGLAICKGIIELMGGEIWVTSELNKGATFHFKIPNSIVKYEEKMSSENLIEVVKTNNKTILIAEDEETNFWYLEAVLEPHSFNLIHVVNGKEAVEAMQHHNNIDLILMDFNMPVMNGVEATKEIRKTHPTIPIIALTAYAMPADRENALAIGCTDYLSKPVKDKLLLELVNKYINTKT